jgi:hypothetical protein
VPFPLEPLDDVLLGQDLGLKVQPQLPGNSRGHLSTIAGQEQQPPDAERAHGLKRLVDVGSQRVGQGDDTEDLGRTRDQHDGFAFRGERLHALPVRQGRRHRDGA